MQAPIAVTVEIRALDVGPRLVRVFRLAATIDEDELRLERDLPFEAGRPVSLDLRLPLPGESAAVSARGIVAAIPPDDEEHEGQAARPRAVRFTALDAEARTRIARYVEERMSA